MPYFTSDGANMYVEICGRGRPLLLLHGFSLDHRQWEPQRRRLEVDRRVFALDWRGHGRSAATPHGHTFAARGSDLERALVQVGIDRLQPGVIVAHSFAADAALRVALATPRSLQGLVLVTPALYGQAWSDDWRDMWRAMRAAARAGNMAEAMQRFRSDRLFDGVRDRPEFDLVRSMQSGCDAACLAGDERDAGEATLERAGACRIPVLVVSAGRDRREFAAAASTLLERLPQGRGILLPDAGHFANLEDSESVTRAIEDFLQSV